MDTKEVAYWIMGILPILIIAKNWQKKREPSGKPDLISRLARTDGRLVDWFNYLFIAFILLTVLITAVVNPLVRTIVGSTIALIGGVWCLRIYLKKKTYRKLGGKGGVDEYYYPIGPWIIELNEDSFKCQNEKGEVFEFDPKKVQKIKIITNDAGPFSPDVFWKFESQDGVCYFNFGNDIDGSFLSNMQELKGFNNEQLIESQTSTSNNTFIVWNRSEL